MRKPAAGYSLLFLFLLSGFAGLVYQSVWSHYLGLTLGHAAYAQALVLAIYMGGMALGAWLASRYGVRWRRLILAYALVEGAIGALGVVFHPLFLAYTDFSQETVLPAIGSDWLAHAWQWGSAAALIAPQSVLLGMTFPLMSGGYLRMTPDEDGRVLGGLYFTNSIGAAAGALVCTFVLLPWIGMPGAARLAGMLNLAVAAGAAILALRVAAVDVATLPSAPTDAADNGHGDARFGGWILLAAFVTGATSFVYEIGWVRLLNQSLGTTVHSFELMLASFIAGLAFGGLWVRSRSTRLRDAVTATGWAQVLMGAMALLSVPMFTHSFRWVGWMMQALARNDSGYALFDLGSGAIAMAVMFPAAFFAGMTLPLMTMALLRRGHGEASIGRVYAANTVGAIAGVFTAMHVLVPAIGVALSVTLAAFVDVLLGLALLRYFARQATHRGWIAAGACGLLATLASLHWGRPDPGAQASGVFRTGLLNIPASDVKYQRDGKTATVSIMRANTGIMAIATNGKPDAGIQTNPAQPRSADEATMRMAAALPLALLAQPREVAIIGWGSGMTTATFLASREPTSVDTIEIERAMHDGARLFGLIVADAYTDPRSHLRIDDARTWFSTGHRRFDVIVSEPSNPWVSGVASLFTTQFYGLARRHLKPDGLMVQWVQTYELNDHLLATMQAALTHEFAHVDVYLTNTSDLLMVASARPLPDLDVKRLAGQPLAAELASVGLRTAEDFAVRRIGSERVLRVFAAYADAQPYSDFHPVVALEGPRARFLKESSTTLQGLVSNGMPVLDILEGRSPSPAGTVTEVGPWLSDFVWSQFVARDIVNAMRSSNMQALRQRDPDSASHVRSLLAMGGRLTEETAPYWYADVSYLAAETIGVLPADELHGIWIDPVWIQAGAPLPQPGQAVLAAFDAAARRDGARLAPTAMAALQQLRTEKAAPDVLREQMLVLAMLGAIVDGHFDEVARLERTWGAQIHPSLLYGSIRSYLLAWADLRLPALGGK
ncbi:MAG: fused MFS/spermidine synthase [Proteobacteria bacterium]|nr:fused MFS/spermidine synthase [Pseudomonadota bacterium]